MGKTSDITKDLQYWKFSFYGFLKNLQFFDPFLILFFREMGISFLEIGILYSVREIVTNITEIPTGVIADTLGRRTAMILAFASYIGSFLIFYFFPSYYLYIAAMILFALGESFRSGTHKAMIMEYLKLNNMTKQKVAYYGHTRGWAQLGSALSAVISAVLVFFTGSFRAVFLWSIIPYVLGALLIFSYPRNLDFSCDEEDGCRDDAKPGWKDVVKTLKDFLGLFTDASIRRALLNSSLFDAVFKSVKDYVQPVLKTLALSLPLLAALEGNQRVAVVSGIVYCLLYLLTSYASSHASGFHSMFKSEITGLNLTFIFSIILIAGISAFLLAGLNVPAVILFIVFYLLENVRRPATLGYISDHIKGSVMATGLSGESQLKTLFVAIISPLFGFAIDRLGLGGAMIFLAILPALSYGLVRFRKK